MTQKKLLESQLPPHNSKPATNVAGAGAGIGRLPHKATHHIAKEPLPLNAVNIKGQKKVMLPNGRISFVNMREGRVKGPQGTPVKP